MATMAIKESDSGSFSTAPPSMYDCLDPKSETVREYKAYHRGFQLSEGKRSPKDKWVVTQPPRTHEFKNGASQRQVDFLSHSKSHSNRPISPEYLASKLPKPTQRNSAPFSPNGSCEGTTQPYTDFYQDFNNRSTGSKTPHTSLPFAHEQRPLQVPYSRGGYSDDSHRVHSNFTRVRSPLNGQPNSQSHSTDRIQTSEHHNKAQSRTMPTMGLNVGKPYVSNSLYATLPTNSARSNQLAYVSEAISLPMQHLQVGDARKTASDYRIDSQRCMSAKPDKITPQLMCDRVISGDFFKVKKLLSQTQLQQNKGFNINELVNGNSALALAFYHGYDDIAEELLKYGAKLETLSHSEMVLILDPRHLHNAIERNEIEQIAEFLLLTKGVKPIVDINGLHMGYTPLQRACKVNSTEIAGMLVQARAKINIANGAPSALKFALFNKNCFLYSGLIKAGATVIDSDVKLFDLCKLAITENDPAVLEVILEATHKSQPLSSYLSKVRFKDLLTYSYKICMFQCAAVLIDKGVDYEFVFVREPLSVAVECNDLDFAVALCKRGEKFDPESDISNLLSKGNAALKFNEVELLQQSVDVPTLKSDDLPQQDGYFSRFGSKLRSSLRSSFRSSLTSSFRSSITARIKLGKRYSLQPHTSKT